MTDMLWLWKRMVLSSEESVNSGLDYWTDLYSYSHACAVYNYCTLSVDVQLFPRSVVPVDVLLFAQLVVPGHSHGRSCGGYQILLNCFWRSERYIYSVAVQSKWQEERRIQVLSWAKHSQACSCSTPNYISVLYFDSLHVLRIWAEVWRQKIMKSKAGT